jgi:AcrR family transcriptional regulator
MTEIESWQTEKSRLSRNRILDAAIYIIRHEGLSSATANRIARQSGLTWGAVQHHFGAKDDVLRAILEKSHADFIALMSDVSFDGQSLIARADRFIDLMWGHYCGDAYLAAVDVTLGEGRDPAQHTEWTKTAKAHAKEHIAMMRRTFDATTKSEAELQELLLFVHVVLTGLAIDRLLEPGRASQAGKHLDRVKAMLIADLKS